MPMQDHSDKRVLVIGAGIAGLSAALRLADQGLRVDVLFRGDIECTASASAQGGISAAMAGDDSVEAHYRDTLGAGAQLCRGDVVRRIVSGGAAAIGWLTGLGVEFSRDADGQLHLTREGGHSQRRVVHAQDATGWAVMRVLIEHARRSPRIRLLGDRSVMALETARTASLAGPDRCIGVQALNELEGRIEGHRGHAVILATGGAAGIYRNATSTGTGDGIALAWQAGCRVANLEFIQFHPTCLAVNQTFGGAVPLISEALRGEGARLLLPNGAQFMHRYDVRGALAPRDVVARAIVNEMNTSDWPHVLLDISHQPAAQIHDHFPNILKACARHGFDLIREPVPVAPGAHYTCGGIVTDPQGQTDLPRLFALGECSYSGMHGANRLASNSLLEGLVQAVALSERVAGLRPVNPPPALSLVEGAANANVARATHEGRDAAAQRIRALRQLMWTRVGVERSNAGLLEAEAQLVKWRMSRVEQPIGAGSKHLQRALTVALLITRSALQRQESRGTHLNLDWPDTLKHGRDTILVPWQTRIDYAHAKQR